MSHPTQPLRVRVLALIAFLGGTAWSGVPEAEAHLCIVRQGPESRGAIESGDQHGSALATGDFNGDGYEDLATGAPTENLSGGFVHAGAVIVNWGSEQGITHAGSLLLTKELIGNSNESGAEFGAALAAGDFNGDGFDDLAIGAPGSAVGTGTPFIGTVFVLRGNSTTGLTSWFSLLQSDAGGADEPGDVFGRALAVGNFDGATNPVREDLIVGAPGEDGDAGAVFYFLGSPGGLFGDSGWFKQSSLGGVDEAGDGFGHALAAGNLIGDAADELVVGTPFEDGTFSNEGMLYVLRTSLGSGFDGTALQYRPGAFDVPEQSAAFGQSLAVGYLQDENGFESLAVSEPKRTVQGVADAGRVLIFPGNTAGLDLADRIELYEYHFGGGVFAGDRWGSSLVIGSYGQEDGHEDLIIGSEWDGLGWTTAAGAVHVSFGGPNGPGQHGYGGFDQSGLNETPQALDHLGASVAIGAFDGTGWGNIAVGAPGDASDSGMVHIIAPWRQTYGLKCNTSVALGCDGQMVFSQKPFEQVSIASTTKILTVLIGCERTQLPSNHPNHVDIDEVFDIPNWIVDEVPGSQVPLISGEQMSFRNLLYTCLMRSGNDAAYAIGDILGGSPGPGGIPIFVAEMNARAAALGMSQSHFHNAAGLDSEILGPTPAGDHYSTAWDMVRLGRAAMSNPLFREIAETSSLEIVRVAGGSVWTWNCQNILNWIVSNPDFPTGNGIKSGWTPNAELTTVVSADPLFGGDAIAGTFGSPNALGNQVARQNAIDVLRLGLAECSIDSPDYVYGWSYQFHIPNASTTLGQIAGGSTHFDGVFDEDIVFDICAQDGEEDTATADVEISRISELVLRGQQSDTYGIAPFQSHLDLKFQNLATGNVSFEIEVDYLPDPIEFNLEPGQIGTLPAYGGPDASEFSILITALTGLFHLSIEETYAFSIDIPAGPCTGSAFHAVIPRNGTTIGDVVDVRILGTDAGRGRLLHGFVHAGDAVVDVPGAGEVEGVAFVGIQEHGAGPNPFGQSTQLHFELARSGLVQASIFDAGGRRVRSFPNLGFGAGPGSIEWDGRDDRGEILPNGVYLYRLATGGEGTAASGRVVLVR